MKAKNIILVGLGLAVAGGGAYIYMKSKKNDSKTSSLKDLAIAAQLSNNESIISGTPGVTIKDTVLATTPVTNAQAQVNQLETNNQIQAQALATQIVYLNSGKKPAIFNGQNMSTYQKELFINAQIYEQISNIVAQMNKLGYKEVNGVAVKL